jgi:hypothetical protein
MEWVQLLAVAVILLSAGLTIVLLTVRRNYLKTSVNEQIKSKVVLKIAVPRRNDKTPLSAEQLLTALHGLGLNKSKSMDHFSLEIAAGSYGIHFIVVIDNKYKTFIENQIYAQYPEAQITHVRDYTDMFDKTPGVIEITELGLAKDYFLPIRTFANFDVDPLAGITAAMSNLQPGYEIFLQTIVRPVGDTWQQKGKDHIAKLKNKTDKDGNKIPLESGEQEQTKLIETKSSKAGFQFIIRVLVKAPDKITTSQLTTEVLAAFNQYKTTSLNGIQKRSKPKLTFWQRRQQAFHETFVGKREEEKLDLVTKYKTRFLDEFTPGIINTEELASLYHLPNKSVETPNISWASSKKLEYPLNLPTADCRILGETDYRGVHVKYGIKPLDRMRHMYVIGKTGVGKSTFIEGLILADIYEGEGLAVIDPHGELIENVLAMIPEHRKDDVVLFDPGDTTYPVGFNMLEINEDEDKSLVADGIVSVFKKEFGTSWGPRLEYILTNAILTLLHCQNVSLLVLPRLLSDTNYRAFLLKQLKDPILMKFWVEEYEAIARDPKRAQAEISSILNKVGRFTTNPMIRNIVGQVTSTMDIKDIMDNRKILLVNLAQGKVGQENMALLGGMLVTRIYSTVTRRIMQDKSERKPFYLYIDEFQNFSNPTFEKILSEARKFALSLTIVHQFIDQIDEGVRNAVFGNVGTLVNFSVGPKDAEVLVREYNPYLIAEDLVNLGKGEIVTKLSIDIAQSKPFTARTLLPDFKKTGLVSEIVDISRQRYAKPRDAMEQKLYKWAEQSYNKEGNLITAEEKARLAKLKEEKEKARAAFKPGDKPPTNSPPSNNPQRPPQNKPGGNPNKPTPGSNNKPKPGSAGPNRQAPRPQGPANFNQAKPSSEPRPQSAAPKPEVKPTQASDGVPQTNTANTLPTTNTAPNTAGQQPVSPENKLS